MKVVLMLICCWILGVSLGDPIPNSVDEPKGFYNICTAECNVSDDFVDRYSRLEYKSTEEDLCFLICSGRVLKIAENHKYKTDTLRNLFKSYKIVIPDDFKDLKDTSFKDPDFVEKVAGWVTRNKQACLDLTDALRGNVKQI